MKKISKKLSSFAVIFTLIFIFSYIVGRSSVEYHELIHQRIFSKFNISSTIDINYLELSGTTTPVNSNCLKNDICGFEHEMNDIVNYNVDLVIFSMFFIFGLYTFFKIFLTKND